MVLFAGLNEQNCPLANFLDLVVATECLQTQALSNAKKSTDNETIDEYTSWLGVA